MTPSEMLAGLGQDGLIDLVTRVAGPDAANEMARQLGLTGRHLTSGVAGLGAAFANPVAYMGNKALEATGSDYRFPEQYEAVQNLLTGIGFPEPETPVERGVGFAAEIGVPDPSDSARVVAGLSHLVDPNMVANFLDPQWAMTVFHGSPHKWTKPDLSKVGTGEGAQAFGHGFYVAEDEALGVRYMEALRGKGDIVDASGKKITPASETEELAAMYFTPQGRQELDGLLSQGDYPAEWGAVKAKIDQWDSEGVHLGGYLYELDLPDSTIDKMLDWDKPLSEQPESVRKALGADLTDGLQGKFLRGELTQDEVNSIMDKVPIRHAFPQDRSGQALYFDIGLLAQKRGYDGDIQQAASAYMNELGIPGIKYLDGTSRSAGEGTRNFVVFDESYITPLKRNNEPIK